MDLSPAMKRQLTKSMKIEDDSLRFNAIRKEFRKVLPAEQAKHSARKYIAENMRRFKKE